MIPYTAGDSLQAIARTYGFDTVRDSHGAIDVSLAQRQRLSFTAMWSWPGLVLALILSALPSLPSSS